MSDSPGPGSTPNVTVLPNIERDAIAAGFAEAVRLWAAMAEHAEPIARHKRTMFRAYVAAGFTNAEALELVKGISG